MKKKFEMPAVNIHIFQLENVITASGAVRKQLPIMLRKQSELQKAQ